MTTLFNPTRALCLQVRGLVTRAPCRHDWQQGDWGQTCRKCRAYWT